MIEGGRKRERKIVERGEGGTDEEGKVRERRECERVGGGEYFLSVTSGIRKGMGRGGAETLILRYCTMASSKFT